MFYKYFFKFFKTICGRWSVSNNQCQQYSDDYVLDRLKQKYPSQKSERKKISRAKCKKEEKVNCRQKLFEKPRCRTMSKKFICEI